MQTCRRTIKTNVSFDLKDELDLLSKTELKNKATEKEIKLQDKDKKELFLNEDFFNNPYEVLFRSLSDSIKIVGNKYNAVRGKKIDYILEKIGQNSLKKETLGGCVIKKVNQTVIISKEY